MWDQSLQEADMNSMRASDHSIHVSNQGSLPLLSINSQLSPYAQIGSQNHSLAQHDMSSTLNHPQNSVAHMSNHSHQTAIYHQQPYS